MSWRAPRGWAEVRDGARVRVRWAQKNAMAGKLPPPSQRSREVTWRYGRVRRDAPAPPPNLPGMEGVQARPAHCAQSALVCLLDGGGALNLRNHQLSDFEVED